MTDTSSKITFTPAIAYTENSARRIMASTSLLRGCGNGLTHFTESLVEHHQEYLADKVDGSTLQALDRPIIIRKNMTDTLLRYWALFLSRLEFPSIYSSLVATFYLNFI